MPIPLTSAQRTALQSRRVHIVWLLTMEIDGDTVRVCSLDEAVSYGGESYAAGSDKWEIRGRIGSASNLVPEPLTLVFDGGDQFSAGTFTARLVTGDWHLRPIRLEGVMLDPDDHSPIGAFLVWEGYMDVLSSQDADGAPSVISLTCEGGSFRALSKNLRRCTDADQRTRSSGDTFFRNTGIKPSQNVPFGTSWSKVAGHNSGGGGGGGGVFDFDVPTYER